MRVLVASIVALTASTGSAFADVVVYDHMTGNNNLTGALSWAVPSGGGSLASTGSRFLGGAVVLAGGATTITGFDTTMLNNTGAALTLPAGGRLRFNYWVYNTWQNTAGTNPAFANLAGNGSVDINIGAAPINVASNSFFFFAQNASPGPGLTPAAGTLPGIAINPITVAPTGSLIPDAIGIVFNWQLDRNDGNGFVLVGGLTQLLVGGNQTVAPAVGTNAFAAPNMGYYRSASAEVNGNFLGSSSRNIGVNSGMYMRVYSVPAPGAAALLGLGGLIAARRRRA